MPLETTSADADFTGVSFFPSHHDTYPFISPEQHDLHGKHVLITGASKGIGRAIVLSYAAAGASVLVLAARSSLSEVVQAAKAAALKANKPESRLIALQVDVTDKVSVSNAAEKLKNEIGHLDIIINNAGVIEKEKLITEQDPDDWWNVWEVNIKGPFLVLHYFIPLLLASEAPDKTVVAVSSIGAHVSSPGLSAYQPGKLALLRIAEFVGLEFGEKGVLSYSIHPGGVFTEMGEKLGGRWREILNDTPELPGDAVVWLTSERREWLAGRYISCNWDMEELEKRKEEIVEKDLLKVRMRV